LACYDVRGQQVLEACRSANLMVPEEIGVVAVDNDEVMCELASPPMTSIEPNSRRAGYEAAALLDRMMKGEAVGPVEIRIPPVGIQRRQSSDALALEDRQMAAAMRFIREHACEPIQVTDVLRNIPLSRRVFETRFKASLGITPHGAIARARLGRVRQLLAETDLSLDEIAERSGFPHPEYMSVVFKREMGVPPGVFRQNLRR
jgi:LacI family transcriptional regulator